MDTVLIGYFCNMDSKDTISKRFGLFVAKLRNERGMTQEELAFKSGLHRTYIGMIERGERNITLVNVMRLADAFGIRMSEMFSEYEQY